MYLYTVYHMIMQVIVNNEDLKAYLRQYAYLQL